MTPKFSHYNTEQITNTFICHDGKSIHESLLDDLIFDCGPEGEDELNLISLLKHEIYVSCTEPDMIPCKEGHSKCYFLKDVCTYKLNKYNNLLPCRDGGHLHDCRNFECNLMFKCKYAYCVPWSHVCDGKWDCPEGNDELHNPVCTEYPFCMEMYKCRNTTQTCVFLGNVCDGNKGCFFGDGELYCQLNFIKCPLKCIFLLLAIDCANASGLNAERSMQPLYLSVHVSNSKMYTLKYIDHFVNAKIIKLPRNFLNDICIGHSFTQI